jgi:metal-responsive CopG/Arc/MetJ family transcriptional regulator
MERQNLTLSLPKTLLKKAKIFAVKNDKSLSEIIRESLEEKIDDENEYNKAMARHMKLLEKGFDLGTKGKFKVSREELHERR